MQQDQHIKRIHRKRYAHHREHGPDPQHTYRYRHSKRVHERRYPPRRAPQRVIVVDPAAQKRRAILAGLVVLSLCMAFLASRTLPVVAVNLRPFFVLGLLFFYVLLIVSAIFLPSSSSMRAGEKSSAFARTRKQASYGRISLVSQARFKRLVNEALNALPEDFYEQMENVVILVENQPDAQTLERVGVNEGHILLGLYQGVPLTAQGYRGAPLPERITLYQASIETYCQGDRARIREQVRKTLLHEIAHHFGMDHEEMPIWIK
ncbi:MAG TPA: metallopeptidase family protein [Ktedonobacteraceae bacterium]